MSYTPRSVGAAVEMIACVWIGACALLLAGNTLAADVTIPLHIGETLHTRIETFPHPENETSCYLDSPSGETIPFVRHQYEERTSSYGPDKFTLLESSILSACAVDVLITDTKDEGVWRLHFMADSGASAGKSFKVVLDTVGQPAIEESLENDKDKRKIELLDEQNFNTAIGSTHEVRIDYKDFVKTESCHIIAPNGKEYTLDVADSIIGLGVRELKEHNTACGVEISVLSENSVGKWTLFSRATRYSESIEKRLNFNINVFENVRAMHEDVTITEGSDLYVRLEKPTPHYETCKLTGPNGQTDTPYEVDLNHKSACGFIVPNVKMDYAGRWEITYGDTIIYTAIIYVNTNAPWEGAVTKLEWLKDRPVHMEVGPDHAVYCRLTGPEEIVVFESFGRCTIALDRATEEHSGTWTMVVGLPGRVLTDTHTVTVLVKSASPRPQVLTRVLPEQPSVVLSCAIEGVNSIRSCKFIDPSGKVLMAPQGVGEDRYSFHGDGVSLAYNVTTSECGLRITNPIAEEQGMWRCSVVTFEDQVYHGFLKVLLPWVSVELETIMAPTEPTLTATHTQVAAVEGDAVIMRCSIQSAIQYCYFRARNGTIFSVTPSSQSDVMEYVGAGFDAGECGVRFKHLLESDSGPWSCHVGFTNPDAEEEQRATFDLAVQRAIGTSQRRYSWGVVVEGWVHDERQLEYCRFVRSDGFGFGSFSASLPKHITIEDNLSIGHCSLRIENPTIVERQAWTVVAKILGQEVEVYASTDHSLETTPAPPPGPPQIIIVRRSYTWLLFFMLGISLLLMSLSLSSQRNRRWVSQRATSLRDSFRKTPVAVPPQANNNTAMAA